MGVSLPTGVSLPAGVSVPQWSSWGWRATFGERGQLKPAGGTGKPASGAAPRSTDVAVVKSSVRRSPRGHSAGT